MSADAVVLESVTFCALENIPPFGLISGAAAFCSGGSNPYTSTSQSAATYTLPFVTIGMEYLAAGPPASRLALVSLS